MSTSAGMPLVSIIVACYNHEKYVRATLDSILADDYPRKEIVIINDGSKDRSDEIVREWMEEHGTQISIKYRSRPNVGICRTANELVEMASGNYIVPVPSDDLLIPGSIAPRVRLMMDYPDKMVLVSDANVIDENGQVMMNSVIENYNSGNKRLFDSDDLILLSTLKFPQISGPTIMVDRKVYDLIGGYREGLIAEDWYFYQRVAARRAMLFADMQVGQYRVHSSNHSGVNMRGSVAMARTIVLTYWYNWKLMPGIKFKCIALMELVKWSLRYLIYRSQSKAK